MIQVFVCLMKKNTSQQQRYQNKLFLSTSRYFFKTHCVFLELLTPLFVDLSFCNSTPHWDHTGQISILKVHLEVFFPLIKSQLDGWKNICVDIHNNQQFWIQEDGLEYTIFTNLFVLNYPHSEHFSTSSPEFSTFLGYHRGFKKCRHLRELQYISPAGGIPSFAFMSCFKFLSLENSLSNLGGLLTLSKLIFCWQIEFYILTT